MSRLAGETSPYLLQHADNPVDWYPWGDEARAEARRRDVPLFVSIGYSACHWCHVMAHESFEDLTTAAFLNEHFVSVKVDREERPDVDALYMEAVQSLSGGGGWPLTVFATAEGRPFFGGTYFPDAPRHGMPAFRSVLEAVSEAWSTRRGELVAQADELTDAVAARLAPPPATTRPEAGALVERALERMAEVYDAEHPGMGRAPKFPQAPTLELLLRAHVAGRPAAFEMAHAILGAMARGGIYDHLGGGFARYATDRAWQVPHFEKMLYDQALLARTYLHAWQVSGDPEMRQVVDETLGYVLRDLRDPSGGLRSAEDADSDGEEGLFYTWTPDELRDVLGDDAEVAASWYSVSSTSGVLDGRSILHRPAGTPLLRPAHVETVRARLLDARCGRARPGIDDKVLTEWNAMACATLAEAAAATGDERWRTAALEIGETLYSAPRRPDGRWMRSWKDGRATHLAVAADYAWLVECFTRLGEATGQARWTERAVEAADGLVALFSADDGGWYSTGSDAEPLVVRPRDVYDGATPGAGSVATMALARLGALTGDSRMSARAEQGLAAAGTALAASPLAFPQLVSAALLVDRGTVEVVVGAASDPQLVAAVQARFLPDAVLAWGEPTPSPLWEGRDDPGDARGYVCIAGTCLAPASTADGLLAALAASSRARS